MRMQRPEQRPGFTLVEMLVVIAIVGILAAILLPTVMAAIRRAKVGAAAMELKDIESALEAYRNANKDYPPDGTSLPAIKAHFRKAFPRIPNHENYIDAWWNSANPSDTTAPQDNFSALDPAEALVFFLTQLRNDPRDPLGTSGQVQSYYDFEQTKLRDEDGDGFAEYYPAISGEAPLVYFDGRIVGNTSMYNHATTPQPTFYDVAFPKSPTDSRISDLGRVRPYQSNSGAWIAPEKFQLICAGLDSHFGVDYVVSSVVVPKQFPDPNYYGASLSRDNDLDNITNFSEGNTLGDNIP